MPAQARILAVLLLTILSGTAMADIVPPHPPNRGSVADDLPAPEAPASRTDWVLPVAGVGALGAVGLAVLAIGGVVVRTRTKGA